MAGVLSAAGLAVATVGLSLVSVAEAWARPGGGQYYSGGSGGTGSGGGGGDDFSGLIDLALEDPELGIPLIVLVLAASAILRHHRQLETQGHDLGTVSAPPPRPSRSLEPLLASDPDFSPVLFEDFAYALYAEAHRARADAARLAALAPYLEETVRTRLGRRRPGGVAVVGVLVGAMRVSLVLLGRGDRPNRVCLEFDSNLNLPLTTQYVRERWTLERAASAQSRPPERIRDFGCPNCGAPFESTDGNTCGYCREVVSHGRFDWTVVGVVLMSLENRPPALHFTVPEMGTDLPTVFQRDVEGRKEELREADPELTEKTLGRRLRLIYRRLYEAWPSQELRRARPFLSDRMFDYLSYWTEACRRQGLRNDLKQFRLVRWVVAKVVRDRYFDAVTVRIWGTGKDSTVRAATGELVSGDPHRYRPYSEYWTLIRRAGVRGAPADGRACPNCAAELDINMAGSCEYCGARVASGEFDWVLSKIEQDDAYAG